MQRSGAQDHWSFDGGKGFALLILGVIILVVLLVAVFLLWSLSTHLRGLTQLQVELRGVATRVESIERNQGTVGQNLTVLNSELSQARISMTALQSEATVRVAMESQIAESIRRLETVIAGTYSKGAAGENILEAVFSRLPPEWQVRDFRVGNKTVEFGLRLPNNRVLPIDSKWPATDLLERFARCEDPVERRKLKDQIGVTVVAKAREVRKYLDPSLTLTFGVAAVPDAVYDLCGDIQGTCFEMNVVLVAYSMFIPYMLLVFQTVLKTSQDIDLEKLDAHLQAAESSVQALQGELEGRLSRAITMLANSKSEMSAQLSRIGSSLTNVHVGTGRPLDQLDGTTPETRSENDEPSSESLTTVR
jgi:DNA recombination protein RmuC